MRIIHKDLDEDRMKLQTENLNDLWHLQHLICPEDIVTAMTWRRPKSETDKVRPERREKERVKLSIRVKEVEFQKFSSNLRVLGVIEEGDDLGNHHTVKLDTDSKFVLTKDWGQEDLDRVEEAKEESDRPEVLLVALDDEVATFGLVRQYGMEKMGEVVSSKSGKMYESDRELSEKEFFGEVCSKIKNHVDSEEVPSIIIAGPGMSKKKILSFMEDEHIDLVDDVHLGNTSHTGTSGLNEIVKRGIVKRVSEEDRISKETELVEELLKRISSDGKATYGLEEIEQAVGMGAIETLLVSDERLRKDREEVAPLIETARQKGAEVEIISSEHDAGVQLSKIGGLAALLRYKVS